MDFERVKPDDIISFGKEKLKLPKNFPLIVIAIVILIIAFNIFYTIEPYEVGVVTRFGKFLKITNPGLNFKLPFGIEKAYKVNVERKFREEFGYRTLEPGVKTRYSKKSFEYESLMLTGDLNVIEIEWSVQYKIKDPVKFIFNVRNQRKTLRDTSEAVMREVVGDYSFTNVLTERMELGLSILVKTKMQEILDFYGTGIQIVTIEFQGVMPSVSVQSAFNEENEAQQEKETMINRAWQVYNQKIPEARGEAEKILSEAEGYAAEIVNKAQGDAERFMQVLSAYKKAKEVTKRRIYLDTLKEVVQKTGKIYVIDPEVKGLVPLLNLEKNEQ